MSKVLVWIGQVCVEWVFVVYLGLLMAGLFVACFCRGKEGFTAWLTALFGGFLFVLACQERISMQETVGWIALALLVSGVSFLLLSFVLFVRRWRKRRGSKMEARKRRLEFTLPDRKNEYLRARLDGVLKAREEERSEAGVKLEYVRSLLARLKAAPLAAVERMRTEELSKQITLYCSKEGLTAEEKQSLGDCFSALLQLSAKYEV